MNQTLRNMTDLCDPQPTALKIADLSVMIDRTSVLENLSLTLAEGHLLCLLGPSGGGKSTLLRAIAGLEVATNGTIELFGEVVTNVAARVHRLPEKRGVGLMFQDFALFPHMTVLQNILFGLNRINKAEAQERARCWIARVGLNGLEQRLPSELSGGQQQRVALARSLAPEPALLLLDEPFSGLDQRLRSDLRDDFLHLIKQSGTTAIMVTHDPQEAMFMADSIAVMREGKIEQRGQPDELYFAPRSEFVAGFFGEVNLLPGRISKGAVYTALGQLKEDCLAAVPNDNCDCRVLIRAEAIRLCPVGQMDLNGDSSMPLAEVQTARMIGNESVIHLTLLDDTVPEPHVHAKVPGAFLPAAGERFGLGFNPDLIYAFPTVNAQETT